MATLTPERVLATLEAVKDPDLGASIVAMGMIKDIHIDGGKLTFTCELTTPACPVKEQIEKDIRGRISASLPEVTELNLTMTGKVRSTPVPVNSQAENLIPQIKNVILVGSGKGGVGKSTCAVNVALALKRLGARVALLDCDIYGPSIPIMTGITERPKLAGENTIKPLVAFDMEVMSMGFLVEPNQAMIWRGPILNGIIVQFLKDVTWSEQDYLVVDLPPGTGDVHLSIAQNCSTTGAMLVTTPQKVALADVYRAKAMFDQTKIPVLGLLENMAGFIDAASGRRVDIFSQGGGERAAAEMCIPLLGSIPLDPSVCESGDAGKPIVVAQPESAAAKAFIGAAEKLAAQISIRNLIGEASKPLGAAK
ncbi:MAG TPA: Mrp/NBP35 family ATP-binding protein [Planctomycetota bacterium]|nr:Mrp/NBP35 family ATP-binding protein [Planctomycetota bacterium]